MDRTSDPIIRRGLRRIGLDLTPDELRSLAAQKIKEQQDRWNDPAAVEARSQAIKTSFLAMMQPKVSRSAPLPWMLHGRNYHTAAGGGAATNTHEQEQQASASGSGSGDSSGDSVPQSSK